MWGRQASVGDGLCSRKRRRVVDHMPGGDALESLPGEERGVNGALRGE